MEGNVYDDVDKQDEAKKVNFDLNTTKDAVCQAEFGCGCCQNQNNGMIYISSAWFYVVF